MLAFLASVVEWSLRNRPVVLMGTFIFVLFGLDSARRLPIDAIPDVTTIQVPVITTAPALSPVEVEQHVTVPVERAMAGLPGLTELRSISKHGLSMVTVVFNDDTDIYRARALMMERLRQAESTIPSQYGKPELGPISTGLGEVYQFALRSKTLDLATLQDVMDWQLAPELRMVPGVVEVNAFGGSTRQFQVRVDPARMQDAGLSLQDVADAVGRANQAAGGGYLEVNREHMVVSSMGQMKSVEDLRNVVLGATPQGKHIVLSQVAQVREGGRLRLGAATMDGEGEVVVGIVLMLMGENSRVVTHAVKERLDALFPSLPKGVELVPFYDRSVLVDRTIKTVGTNLLEGALLVIAILLLLLGGLRAGLVAAITIPLAMLFALIMMRLRGMSGNLMSLGAIDFGLIVDGAVIIVENCVRRLHERARDNPRPMDEQERIGVIHDATMEVRGATMFGEAIIALVYVPILALGGMEGKLFRPMAFTVLFALLGAFLLTVTVVPVLCTYLLRPQAEDHDPLLMRLAARFHAFLLPKVMKVPVFTLVAAVLLLLVTGGVFSRMGGEFIPTLDEGELLIEARRLPGAALSESVAMDLRTQNAIKDIPEIQATVSRAGAPSVATDPMGLEQSDTYIILKPREDWRPGLTKAALGQEILERVEAALPDMSAALSQPIEMRTNELVAGVRSDVAAFVFGPDLQELARLGQEVVRAMERVPGAVDVRMEQVAGLKYLRIYPDRARLAARGLSVADINLVAETLAVGHVVGRVYQGERRYELAVLLDHGFEGSLDTLRSLPLRAPTGQVVPLGEVATVVVEEGPSQVSRERQSRRLTVEFNVRDRDMVGVVKDAQAAVATVALPAGYRITWGGQFENYQAASDRLMVAVPLALVLILFLLWMAFSSVGPALIIFSAIPMAMVGGVLALWARDLPFSISAGVGFIALSGVAVLNGLVLVTFARRVQATGVHPANAMEEAARLRLRPVLMTAAVAALGFVPMAVSQAPGAEVQRPLATVVIGGLASSTALTLAVLPAFYRVIYGRRRQAPVDPGAKVTA